MKKRKKLEIYIHIPFCVRKCNYCDFLSFSAKEELQEQYTAALEKEINCFFSSDDFLQGNYKISSVFIGGGTPSLLKAEHITRLLALLPPGAEEITIEANPGTLDEKKLSEYRRAGINRISLGVQSVHPEELKLLGRIHSWEQAQDSFRMARKAGFQNISLDLMSGLPGQSVRVWQDTLTEAAALAPEHISAYSLILEEGTPFFSFYGSNPQKLPSEEETSAMYEMTGDFLSGYGYRQYEISNYAKPGYECLHNLGYWERTEYIGFGLGAASLLQETRFQNTDSMKEYLAILEAPEEQVLPKLHRNRELLDRKSRMEETMFLGLRCRKGVSADRFYHTFGQKMTEIYGDVISRYCSLGYLEWEQGRLRLTKKALLVSNVIMQEFLLD